jgi:hypothetical protein
MPELTEAARSFYLEQAPPNVLTSLRFLHRRGTESHDLAERRHLDTVFTYLTEVMAEAIDLHNTVAMAGLVDDPDDDSEAR